MSGAFASISLIRNSPEIISSPLDLDLGATKKIAFERRVQCPVCDGRGAPADDMRPCKVCRYSRRAAERNGVDMADTDVSKLFLFEEPPAGVDIDTQVTPGDKKTPGGVS